MQRRQRLVQRVLECVVAFVLLAMSVVGTGAITLPVAQVAPHQASAQAPAASSADRHKASSASLNLDLLLSVTGPTWDDYSVHH